MKMKKRAVEITKKGYPALWEEGGGWTNTGEATIIAGKDGQPKKPIYIRTRGHLSNSLHALFILEAGDYIIDADHHREDFEIEVYQVTGFEEEEGETFAQLKRINCFSMGEWDTELSTHLENAVQAAMKKATCYHCREPHFIETK